jgi:hypothetical protein
MENGNVTIRLGLPVAASINDLNTNSIVGRSTLPQKTFFIDITIFDRS